MAFSYCKSLSIVHTTAKFLTMEALFLGQRDCVRNMQNSLTNIYIQYASEVGYATEVNQHVAEMLLCVPFLCLIRPRLIDKAQERDRQDRPRYVMIAHVIHTAYLDETAQHPRVFIILGRESRLECQTGVCPFERLWFDTLGNRTRYLPNIVWITDRHSDKLMT